MHGVAFMALESVKQWYEQEPVSHVNKLTIKKNKRFGTKFNDSKKKTDFNINMFLSWIQL